MHLVWFSFGWIEKKGECPPQKISHFLCKIWFVLTKKVTARDVRLAVQPLFVYLITHFLSDTFWFSLALHKLPGVPQKNLPFFKSAYLRPLISLRKSSILEMNLWISSFKSTKSEFSRIFRFRAIKGIKHMLHFSRYIWLTFEPSEMSNYSKMACIWPKIIIFQV